MYEKRLSYELINEQPRYFDFSQPGWEVALPLNDDEIRNERYVPIYNRLYPLGERFKIPRAFRDLLNNMTVVSVDDVYHLALTGCGMDFTWEICETYLNLGYAPPVVMTNLPAMSDRGTSKKDKAIVNGCLSSLDAMVSRYLMTRDHLRRDYLR